MKMKAQLTALGIFAVASFAVPARADDTLDADSIVRRASEAAYYQGKDGRAQVEMIITDGQGRTRERAFTILRRDDDAAANGTGDQKYYVYFSRPADVSKMVFMVWKHSESDDDRWLYLPALDLVKRIAASDKRTSFVGSHFFYEDVSGRNINADTHELVETTDNFYVIKNTPKDPKAVEFSEFTVWIHRDTFIPVKTKYVDKAGRPYREYEAVKVERIEGFPTVVQARMKDLKAGGETTLTYSNVDYDVGIPEEIFSERYLRTPPRQYLR